MNFKFFLFVILIVGISFSRIKTDDVEALDSIKGATGTFSGALTGTTLNTGYGANELHPMNQGVRTTDDVTFDSTKTRVSTADNSITAGIVAAHRTSAVTEPYVFIQSANEGVPYGMFLHTVGNGTSDLKVKIGSPHSGQKDSVVIIDGITGAVNFSDSLKIGTGSYLKTYVEGSFPCTLKTSDVTVQQIGTAYYTKVGNKVHISFPDLTGTSNSSDLEIYCSLPYSPKQLAVGNSYVRVPIIATDNGSNVMAFASWSGRDLTNNRIIINKVPFASFTSSGTKGVFTFELSYITE